MVITVLVIVLMGLVAGLAIREGMLFLRARETYGLRRLTIRVSTAFMMLYLLGSVLLGIRLFALDSLAGQMPHWMAFWGSIGLLAAAIICLVIADFRTVADDTRAEAHRRWRDIAETLVTQAEESEAPKGDRMP